MNINTNGGKGSGVRPREVPKEQFDNNWDAIFGKKKDTKEDQPSNTQKK